MISPDSPVQSERSAGSPQGGEPAFIVVGRLRKPHGIRGEIMMELLTEFPERIQAGLEVYVGKTHQLHHIRNCRGHQKAFIVSFQEYEKEMQQYYPQYKPGLKKFRSQRLSPSSINGSALPR